MSPPNTDNIDININMINPIKKPYTNDKRSSNNVGGEQSHVYSTLEYTKKDIIDENLTTPIQGITNQVS